MDFGTWIKKIRLEKNLDLQSLASITGVDASTINRIENDRSEATLNTVVRICTGVSISARDCLRILYDDNSDKFARAPIINVSNDNPVLTIRDVDLFLEYFYRNPEAARQTLSDLLNDVISKQMRISHWQLVENPFIRYTPSHIDHLLYPPSIERNKLTYPEGGEIASLLVNALSLGGALWQRDTGAYIRSHRLQLSSAAKDLPRESRNLLDRLEKSGIPNAKLADILFLDEHFSFQGEMLSVYWRATEFHIHLDEGFGGRKEVSLYSPEDQRIRLGFLVVTIARWLQFYYKDDAHWLQTLRLRVAD